MSGYAADKPSLKVCDSVMIPITPMSAADIPAVMEIEKHSQLEPWSKEAFLQELGQPFSYIYVARFAGGRTDDRITRVDRERGCSIPVQRPPQGIIGYICFWTIADEVQILNLAVHRSCRKQGIALALLLCCLEMGCELNARIAVLEVRKSNIPAQLLYRSVGFRPVGERPDYYDIHKEPAILMELEMDERWKSQYQGEAIDAIKD